MKMVEMDAAAYRQFQRQSLDGYAADLSQYQDISVDQGHKDAETSFAQLLPKGQQTENNYFYNLVDDDGGRLGYIWFLAREKSGKRNVLICDIFVDPTHRGAGLGKFMLEWLDHKVREIGLGEIILHVFAQNQNAVRLYEKTGYKPTNIYMRKKL